MLNELRVRDLGVVEDVSLVFRPGMATITGETGAGKTMLTEAIRLLTGGRAEPQVVRNGATEAVIEGRFFDGENDIVLSRVVPADGRSRAYVDGRMAPVSALAEVGDRLVDLHGQHAHQALLSGVAQRRGLDAFGGVATEALIAARNQVAEVEAQLQELGGDGQARAREMDLLRFQIEELNAASLSDAHEDERLREEEESLAGAVDHRSAADAAHHLLSSDGGAGEQLGEAAKSLTGHQPLEAIHQRLVAAAAEITDLSLELSALGDTLQDDPQRLAEVQERRAALKQLQRKYGPSLEEVLSYFQDAQKRLDNFERHDERVGELEAEREKAQKALRSVEKKVRAQRQECAPRLAAIIEANLHHLALPKARFSISVDGDAGDDVTFELGANPGMPLLPVAKAASGGELARTMLAMRLALLSTETEGPQTLIFDEVDAGIGGEAAIAVGRALSRLSKGSTQARQVFVVTHLAQVAAFADEQILVKKSSDDSTTTALVRHLQGDEREVELARMLSGRPDSESGRAHARELLDAAKEDLVNVSDGKVSKKAPRSRSVLY